MSNFFSKPEIRKLNRMSYTMTWFCSDLNYMPSIFSSKPRVLFTVFDTCRASFAFGQRSDHCFSICTQTWFLSLSISPPLLSIPLSSPLDQVCVSVFFLSRSPRGTHSSLPPHHLIIIHLGGRISAAWDIKPITQSWQSTSPSPPALLSLSRRGQIYWKEDCA